MISITCLGQQEQQAVALLLYDVSAVCDVCYVISPLPSLAPLCITSSIKLLQILSLIVL